MKIMKHNCFRLLTILSLLIGCMLSQENFTKEEDILRNGPLSSHTMGSYEEFTPNDFSSFLEVNEGTEDKTEELSKLSNMMKMMLMSKQSNRTKKRYTEDGRLCASAFAQDGQTFFDCTNTRSPDGQNKNREWCYVDAAAKGAKPWDYCKPIMDYDKVREENQNQLKQFSIEARKVLSEIEAQISPGQQALDNLKRIRSGQAELDAKINALIKEIPTINNNLQNLFNSKSQWESEEEKAVELAQQIEFRQDKKREDEANSKPVEMDRSEDTIRKEATANKSVISPHLQTRTVVNTYECLGMLGYEEEASGDGINGQYYDNESFTGEYKEKKDGRIDFDWTGAAPADGINSSNFSVRWEGYIYAPITSNYQFSVECDDGAAVTINNQIIVSHNMFTATEESKKRVNNWLTQEVTKRMNPSKNYSKSTSKPIRLAGGSKYRIVVSYYHSIHNDFQDDDKSFMRLYWESDDFEERLVSKRYLFTNNSYAPLKVSGLNPEVAIVRKLLENDLAFKDTEEYIIKDIPAEYKGLTCLKLKMKYTEKTISFHSNVPVIVYIGRIAHFPNPVPNDFENTGNFMSMLQIQKPGIIGFIKSLISSRSSLIKIYKKKYNAGQITIPLNQQSINAKGIPMIVFYGFDSNTSNNVSCGGKELWLSNPSSSYYKTCSQSSYYNANWKCNNGLNGKNKDKEGQTWATRREGVGAWLSVEFKGGVFQITKIKFQNRGNPAERNSLIIAKFSNGEEHQMKVKNINEEQTFNIEPPIKSSSVKFTVKDVYGTINNGGSFKVYGNKCVDPEQADKEPSPGTNGLMKIAGIASKALASLFKPAEPRPVVLTCKDSLANTKKLDHIPQKAGNTIKVRCQESCGTSREPIYGDGKYSKDSAICKAAFHAQKLSANGGLVQIVFTPGLANYKGQVRNGIKSKNKKKSEITLEFKSADEIDEIIVQTGTKVDILSDNKWQPGMINQVKETPSGKVVSIKIEGSENSKPIELVYPNKTKIKPCGDKVKGRDCKGSRVSTNTNRPIKIKFAPQGYNKPGDYLLDNGATFGKCGKAYGWSKDMSNRVKERIGANRPELETLVEFPPSPKSKFCNGSSPEVLCDKVTWSMKAGHGKFKVKLYVGDPLANTRLDLKVNDQYLVKGQTLAKGQLEIYEGNYETINEYITISSDCEEDCEYAMSKLNMVEIYPYNEEAIKDDEPTPEQSDPCGNATQGGRCDKGPDVTHCLYEEPAAEGARHCTGNLLMVQIDKQYRCPSQRGKFKCVKRQYRDKGECLVYCPGKCDKAMCL